MDERFKVKTHQGIILYITEVNVNIFFQRASGSYNISLHLTFQPGLHQQLNPFN